MDKFFKGIEERAILYCESVRADFVAVFADNQGVEAYASIDFLTKACITQGFERKKLYDAGITMFQIERAHRQFAYENVRLDVAKKERKQTSKDDLLSLNNIFADNTPMLGVPSFDRRLMGYQEVRKKMFNQSISTTLYGLRDCDRLDAICDVVDASDVDIWEQEFVINHLVSNSEEEYPGITKLHNEHKTKAGQLNPIPPSP